jgi:hypothetical protein
MSCATAHREFSPKQHTRPEERKRILSFGRSARNSTNGSSRYFYDGVSDSVTDFAARRASRRSFASSSLFGSVTRRSSNAMVKSTKSSASAFVMVPACAPSLPSSRMHVANSRNSTGRILWSNIQARRRPNVSRGFGFVLSVEAASKGSVTKSYA